VGATAGQEGESKMVELKESIKTIVVDARANQAGNERELEIQYDTDVLDFYLDGRLLLGGDWLGNFRQVFARALEIWPAE
jgi:hypothetical protein